MRGLVDRTGQAVLCEGSRSETWDGPALTELKPHAGRWSGVDLAWTQLGQDTGTLLLYLHEMEAVVAMRTLEKAQPLSLF